MTDQVIQTPVVPVQNAAPAAQDASTVAPQASVQAPTEGNSTSAPSPAPNEAAVVAAPEAAAVEAPKTVLGEALTEKPKEAPVEVKTEEQKSEQGGQSDEPAPSPTYEAWKVPEGITLDNDSVSQFTTILADLETKSKADHALVQEFGQKAVDFHLNELNKAQEKLTEFYKQHWEKQKIVWKDAFLKDTEIGGNRFQTTVDSALSFIRTHGGTPEQQAEFKTLMETSGLGNHPAMIRLLANAGRAMSEGKPLAASKPVSAPKSKTATLYGNV